ncbi:MAG: ornithine carbamoyltransferase [Chloroflexi bacterium]|jgi:ornithine carbamoyltransferase|nr:MAG: ornithine carbamoyltransferase [Chloroflexota bacterium]
MLFEKPSLRTKVSFDVGIRQMGGHPIYLGKDEVGLGGREAVSDVARVLSRYVDAIVARVFKHNTLEELAMHASIPVINALSDSEHPCQALGDMLTIEEHIGLSKRPTIAFIGDGNNVASSLALAATALGSKFIIASPIGYELPKTVVEKANSRSSNGQILIHQVSQPQEAITQAEVIYTDVWTSMGQENESTKRNKDFENFQITPQLMDLTKPGSIFMHPLPAHQGQEVSSDMLDDPRSVVFDQAENRLHAQKAIFAHLLERST